MKYFRSILQSVLFRSNHDRFNNTATNLQPNKTKLYRVLFVTKFFYQVKVYICLEFQLSPDDIRHKSSLDQIFNPFLPRSV